MFIKRRQLLASAAAGAALLPAAGRSEPEASWRRFELTTRVTLMGDGPARLWLPLAQTAGGYQSASDPATSGSGHAVVTHDTRYGADVLSVDWDRTTARTVEVVQVVATLDRSSSDPTVPVTEAERRFWSGPTESLPTDGIVKATASKIVAGKNEPRARLRAIYDWVVENTTRNPSTPGCGLGDIAAMLESGHLTGKCVDINSLMTGLARAAGFPARDVYGIRVGASHRFPFLGAGGAITKAQHCRSEVYLPDHGWFPVDPADVAKVVLEQKLTLRDPQVQALREYLFGSWEMNWVGFNSATDIDLPGLKSGQKPNFAFLMYPCAFVGAQQPDTLEPGRFRYEITSRELT
jgi:transglutaminase-like putative cysteine protease